MKYGSYETKPEAQKAAAEARKKYIGAIFFFSPNAKKWEVRVRTDKGKSTKGGKAK